RPRFIELMAAHGVQVSARSPCLHDYPYIPNDRTFPNAARYSDTLVMLPSGPEQPLENVERSIAVIREIDPLLT
ncbi:MAG: hypothetical protein HQL59_09755, partial [Magnetococcales bacterium]|nr:hypothetical protein [Magnetococcales bacterium]